MPKRAAAKEVRSKPMLRRPEKAASASASKAGSIPVKRMPVQLEKLRQAGSDKWDDWDTASVATVVVPRARSPVKPRGSVVRQMQQFVGRQWSRFTRQAGSESSAADLERMWEEVE